MQNLHSPEFQTYETRVASFENWPMEMEQTKENMAKAGLFYTGMCLLWKKRI
jgi:hypothetical protein